MKTLFLFIFGVVAILGQPTQVLDIFAAGNVQFSAEIYKELLKTNSGNFLVCPLSAQVILALAHAGAKGSTAEQLATGLHLPNDKSKIQDIFLKLSPYLQVSDKYVLTSANKIYVANRFKLVDNYKSTAVNVFSADIQNIDFTRSQEAASEMNKWVADKTYNIINDLIEPNKLTPNTVAVLINAMYFKADWENQFDAALTVKSPFFVNNSHQVDVDMMNIRYEFNYHKSEELNAQFVELPYKGDDVTMTVVLPKHHEGLNALEARISDVLAAPHRYHQSDVSVNIPKFKIESTIKFKPILETLGVVDAFKEGAADFTDMGTGQGNVYVTEVAQKAFIEVTEKGTTAGASTAVYTDDRSTPQRFVANHPFIFFLSHKSSGVFFVGRFTTPEGPAQVIVTQPTSSKQK